MRRSLTFQPFNNCFPMVRFKDFDHNTPMLMPPDLRDWLAEDHIAHFILDAVELIDLSAFHINHSGSGSEQYHPRMMLALLVYCYATGRFHSREIEAATYSDVAVRYICCNHHPDHDTICTFRRRNGKAFKEGFVTVLLMAQELGELKKIGTISVDGSKFKANASKHSAVSYKRAGEMVEQLRLEIDQLIAKAEDADSTPLEDGLTIAGEISRREERLAALEQARKVIEERFEEEKEEKQKQYEGKKQRRDKMREEGKKPRGPEPKPPAEDAPRDKAQYNLTDPESRIMKKSGSAHFEQSYNVQAAVDADGSMLIVGGYVTDQCNDKQQLAPVLKSIDPRLKKVVAGLADTGYFCEDAIIELEKELGLEILCAVEKHKHGRTVEQLEKQSDPPEPPDDASFKEIMRHRLKTKERREKYKLRKETVEPVFGIIKAVLGFREFSLRGLDKVNIEWDLVKLSYNVKKLFKMAGGGAVSRYVEKMMKNA